MSNTKQCSECQLAKNLTENKVYCGSAKKTIDITNQYCAAQNLNIKGWVRVANEFENEKNDYESGRRVRNTIIELRNKIES